MGASVTAVREAIIQLEAEGLITKRTNTTTNVTVLTAEEIAQTFVVRQALERVAMIEAARRAKPDDVTRLTELFGRMMEAAHKNCPACMYSTISLGMKLSGRCRVTRCSGPHCAGLSFPFLV